MMKARIHLPLSIVALAICACASAGNVSLTYVKTISGLSFGNNTNQISDILVVGNDIYYVGRLISGTGNVSLGKVSGWQSASTGSFVSDLGAGVANRAGRLDSDGTYIYYGRNLGDSATMQIERRDLSGALVTGGSGFWADGILTQAENGNNLLQGMAIAPSYSGGAVKIGGVQLGSSGYKGSTVGTGVKADINPPSGPTGNRRDISFFDNGDAVLDQDGAIRLLTRSSDNAFNAVPSTSIGTGIAGSFATVQAVSGNSFFDPFVAFNATGNVVSINSLTGTTIATLDGTAGGNIKYANSVLNYYYANGYMFVSGWDGTLGSRIDVYATQAVPEPLSFIGFGVAAVAMIRRRKRQ